MKRIALYLVIYVCAGAGIYAQTLKTNRPEVDKAFSLAVATLERNTPDSLIKAGGTYGGEWTRDVSINSWNAATLLMPEKAAYSLWSVCTDGRTRIGHQTWDHIIWVIAAWDFYQKTGDLAFLRQAYTASQNTMREREGDAFDAQYGLFTGPSVFNDGIAGYDEPVFTTAIHSSYVLDYPEARRIHCLSTNSVYFGAYQALEKMATLLGDKAAAKIYRRQAKVLRSQIRTHLYNPAEGRLNYLIDGFGKVHTQQEGLGVAFAILFGVLTPKEAQQVIRHTYVSAYGLPSIHPHFHRFDDEHPGRHNSIIWPFVNAFWADACEQMGRGDILETELLNLANLAINKSNNCFYEIYNAKTGEQDGGWQQGDHWPSVYDQTWSATGFLRMVLTSALGMEFTPEGLTLSPDVAVLQHLGFQSLTGLRYRNGTLDITVSGTGSRIKALIVNGQRRSPKYRIAPATGTTRIEMLLSH